MYTLDEKKAHWKGYWERTNNRPLLSITIPKPGVEAHRAPRYLEAFKGGSAFQLVADQLARWYESHLFLEDAIPYYALTFGADDFAAFTGSDLQLSADGTTSWSVKTVNDLAHAKIAFDPNGEWWSKTAEFYHVLRKTLGNSIMISAPTLSAGLDGLAAHFGVSELLIALMDEPELVLDVLAQVNQAYTDAMKASKQLFEFEKYGSTTRHGMYTQGDIGVPQCDFSCMISSEMFEEFALPSLRHEMSELTYAEYHLDGPGAIRHLEALCRLEKLHTVQWVPGSGEAERQDWLWLYQKIVDCGKSFLAGGSPSTILRLNRKLHTNAAFYIVYSQDEHEVTEFLREFYMVSGMTS